MITLIAILTFISSISVQAFSKDEREEMLKKHNTPRKTYWTSKGKGARGLKWNYNLANCSTYWAFELINNNRFGYYYHSDLVSGKTYSRTVKGKQLNTCKPPASYGENMYYTYECHGSSMESISAADEWLGEKSNYNDQPFNADQAAFDLYGGYGHYTQMMWGKTTEVGCGKAYVEFDSTPQKRLIVVCQYYTAGNIVGKKLSESLQ